MTKEVKNQTNRFIESATKPFDIVETTITTNTVEIVDDKENIVDTKERKEYRVLLGNQAISQTFESEEEAEAHIQAKPWEMIMAVISIFTTNIVKHEMESKPRKI